MEAHPFMFGASKALGYQGVALPSAFADPKSLAFLERSCADFGVGSGEACVLTTVHPDHGPLSLFFRTRHATNVDIGGPDSTLLGDQYGRRIVLSEGVLVRGHHPTMKLTREQLDQASVACRSKFTEFWEAHEWPAEKAISTQPFPLARGASDSILHVNRMDSPHAGNKPVAESLGKPQSRPNLKGNLGGFSERFGWSNRTTGVVMAAAIATVAVGAFLFAEHRRLSQPGVDTPQR